jgi:hypothetical protein
MIAAMSGLPQLTAPLRKELSPFTVERSRPKERSSGEAMRDAAIARLDPAVL